MHLALARHATSLAASLALTVLPVVSLAAQGRDVPTFAQVSGHAFGERITQHHEMVRYLEALAATSDRVQVVRQGTSWEGRELMLAIVSAPENLARLDAIRANSLALADARRTDPAAAESIIATQPAIVWFGGSIHGFELSGSEGALKLLEHLTTRSDAATQEVLRETVILIDPMLNPDGRDAFAHLNHENIGREPASNPDDWSNDFTGWQSLKFRTGHYYFDTNRDWFAQTQRETRERMPHLHAWRPQVAIDMHEQGNAAEFYFDPPGEPANPHFPAFAHTWFATFGAAYAQAFDSAGFEYFSRERYNYFYPGYTSNRGYQGAVAMLFEQGSTRGLAGERGDGTIRTLTDALTQQYTAAWAAVRLAATRRQDLLRDYHASQRAILAPPAGVARKYLIASTGNAHLARELITLLRRNDVEVGVLEQETRFTGLRDRAGAAVADRTFPAGTWVIDPGQPSGRLIRALLDPSVPIQADFLEQARLFTDRDENPRFYDITGWSLPLLFNMEGWSSTDARAVATRPAADPAAVPVPRRASYAYIVDGSETVSAAALSRLKEAGHRAAYLFRATRIGTETIPAGSIIARVGQNDATLHDTMAAIARELGVRVISLDQGLALPGGPDLGSGDWTFQARTSRIAMVAEDPVQGYSFGWAWYTLDRQYGIPVTVLRAGTLANRPLHEYDVLVLPEMNTTAFRNLLGEEGRTRIDRWVRDGGTLVTIGSATEFARTQFTLGLRSWYDTDDAKGAKRFSVPGAVFATRLDSRHWMAGGSPEMVPMLVNSNRLYLPPDGPVTSERRVIATYAGSVPLSGHAWPETQERIDGKVFVYEERVGRGRVIAFAEDPNFRAYLRGANRLFLNAVLLGPSAP